jgi:hypothetical protein
MIGLRASLARAPKLQVLSWRYLVTLIDGGRAGFRQIVTQ